MGVSFTPDDESFAFDLPDALIVSRVDDASVGWDFQGLDRHTAMGMLFDALIQLAFACDEDDDE